MARVPTVNVPATLHFSTGADPEVITHALLGMCDELSVIDIRDAVDVSFSIPFVVTEEVKRRGMVLSIAVVTQRLDTMAKAVNRLHAEHGISLLGFSVGAKTER